MVADIGVHRRAVALGNIGRIRHDHVETLRKGLGQSSERIRLAERHVCAQRPEILRGDGQRIVRNVGGENRCPGQSQGQRCCDTAASRSDIQHSLGCLFVAQNPVDELFGLGTRDQYPFAYGKAAAVEFRISDDVLQGFPGYKLRFGPGQSPDGEFRLRIGQQRRRRESRKLGYGGQRDAAGFACVVKPCEPCGQRVDGLPARHQRIKSASAMATAASTTTAPRRATQTSWRPWISSGSTLFVARL